MFSLSFLFGVCAGFVVGSFIDPKPIVAKIVAWFKSIGK